MVCCPDPVFSASRGRRPLLQQVACSLQSHGLRPSEPPVGHALAGPSYVEMGCEGQGEKGLETLRVGGDVIMQVYASRHSLSWGLV